MSDIKPGDLAFDPIINRAVFVSTETRRCFPLALERCKELELRQATSEQINQLKAHLFVKQYGIEQAKQAMLFIKSNSINNGKFVKELKQIIEHHILIDNLNGLDCAKETLQVTKEIGYTNVPIGEDILDGELVFVFEKFTNKEIEQAIQNVERCKGKRV